MNQEECPLAKALQRLRATRLVPFDVPGHKRGRGLKELADFLGERCLELDVNSQKPLDNLCHPVSVIKEAEELAAETFSASRANFILNGTTQAVQAMIMAACRPGEKIILPRNVHRSAINALIMSGAIPVYVNPNVDTLLGISLGLRVEELSEAIKKNPDAKAVLVNNPTYYGICSNLKAITELAHDAGLKVLVDEAHGTHFYFNEKLPMTAMAAGADMAAVSMHKSGGSLTQTSLLLIGADMNADYVNQIINLMQTTSGSYLLMVSLDIARRNLALHGNEIFDKVIKKVEYARDEINAIGGWYAYSKELADGDAVYDFDVTKLSIYTRSVGLAGVEVYDILRDEYDIQVEFGDIANILAYVSIGDRDKDIERLISALADIKRIYRKDPARLMKVEYIAPIVELTPQEAFYSEKESIDLNTAAGEIAGEFLMSYPPGIPILAPGERITKEIIEYVRYAKRKGCQLTGTQDMSTRRIQVIKGKGNGIVV